MCEKLFISLLLIFRVMNAHECTDLEVLQNFSSLERLIILEYIALKKKKRSRNERLA